MIEDTSPTAIGTIIVVVLLQQVPLEEGQRITTGANLARVGDPAVLKAELRIAETQAKDIQIGQPAAIDTRNGVIPGHVTRIDPAVENATVTVDVALDGELPRGARPDLTVDGTIELERMDGVLFVGRPVFGQGERVSLFRVEEDATFGRTSCANPRTRYPGRGAQSSRCPGRASSCGWYHAHAARRSMPGGGSRALVAAATPFRQQRKP